MSVADAVRARRSVRAFLDRPVPPEVLRQALETAARAPSGGNLQPWRLYLLAGEPLRTLKEHMQRRLSSNPQPDPADYPIYPPKLGEPYRTYRFAVGEDMYGLVGISREDKLGRLRWLTGNFRFWDAPVGLFCYVDRQMGSPQWSDLGMYLQTLMLLLREQGIDTCPQEAWSSYHRSVAECLQPPAEWMLFCGMAIGYADPDAAVNRLQTQRMPLEQFATFLGF
ncbi:MAG: nitroreductase [Nevskia sp.]|nr:nitroreductase [Nevskia sp.]